MIEWGMVALESSQLSVVVQKNQLAKREIRQRYRFSLLLLVYINCTKEFDWDISIHE
jgi:hypothetical protein